MLSDHVSPSFTERTSYRGTEQFQSIKFICDLFKLFLSFFFRNEVDLDRHMMIVLSPAPRPLPRKFFLLSDVKFMDFKWFYLYLYKLIWDQKSIFVNIHVHATLHMICKDLHVSSKIVYRFMGIILNFKRSIWKVSDTCINHNYRNQRKRLSQIILADSFYSLYYRQSWCFSACKYWAVLVCYCLNAPLEISFLRWRTRLQYFFSLWCQSCW